MARRPDHAPPDPTPAGGRAGHRLGTPASRYPGDPEAQAPADLSDLPVAGLTRHRMLVIATCLAVAWLAFAFIRQVGDVTAASTRAEALGIANQQLRADIEALDGELRLIQRQDYIVQQARAYRLGEPREVPFTLEQPLASLPPDAPGSAGVRVGADEDRHTPLEAWLQLLFGPTP
jgi:cell division protein FtsB